MLITDESNPDWRKVDVRDILFKLADFGLSKMLDNSQQLTESFRTTACGTKLYRAPEVERAFQAKQPIVRSNASMDTYSVGIIAYELVTGDMPNMHPPDNMGNKISLMNEINIVIFTHVSYN